MRASLIKEGNFIRECRHKLGFSQAEFSKQIGISQSCLSKIEKGKLQIGIREWFIFCEVCDIHPESYREFLDQR